MNSGLFIRFANYRAFWKVRSTLAHLKFLVSRWALGIRRRGAQELADSRALRGIFRSIGPQWIFAVATATAVQATNPLLASAYTFLGWKAPEEDGIYGTLLAAVCSIGAVFIGLYYAGLTAVGTSTYARLPQSVRELLVGERLGNTYMRFLSFLTFFSLAMLCLRVLGYDKVDIIVPVISLLAGVGILGFVRLGQRAFYLFDPVEISDATFLELNGLARQVTAGSFRWRDPSFQNYARSRASACLDAIDALHVISSSDHLAEKSRLSLLRRLVWFLCQYEVIKSTIPTESYWYERTYEHPTWYFSDDSATSIAHQTGTYLQPETVIKREWIEDRLIALLPRGVADFMVAGRADVALNIIKLSAPYLVALARNSRIAAAVDLATRIGQSVLDAVLKTDGGTAMPDDIEVLAVVEAIASLPIDLLVQYRQAVQMVTAPIEQIDTDSLSKRRPSAVYGTPVPVPVRERFEWLAERLSFEVAVDRIPVSPQWYNQELVAIVAAGVFAACVKALTEQTLALYRDWTQRLRAAKRPWLHAAVISREREYLNKLRHAQPMFVGAWSRLSGNRRIPRLEWPSLDLDAIAAAQRLIERSLLAENTASITALSLVTRPKSFPDYFGQFLHAAGEASMEALLTGDTKTFRSVFPAYFGGCLITFDRLRGDKVEPDDQGLRTIRIAAGPVLDVVGLSGYAKLMSAFHHAPELWSTVESVWRQYLDQPTTLPRIAVLAAILGTVDASFTIPMRGILRTHWNQLVAGALGGVPKRQVYEKGMSLSGVTVVLHPDPLVRLFANSDHGYGMYDGTDIFVDLYLKSRPDSAGVTFPGWKDLGDQIDREKSLYARYGPPEYE